MLVFLFLRFSPIFPYFSQFSYCFPIAFLLFSHCFPVVFLLFSYCFPFVFLLSSYCFLIVFLLFSHCFPIVFPLFSHCFTIVFLLFSCVSCITLYVRLPPFDSFVGAMFGGRAESPRTEMIDDLPHRFWSLLMLISPLHRVCG